MKTLVALAAAAGLLTTGCATAALDDGGGGPRPRDAAAAGDARDAALGDPHNCGAAGHDCTTLPGVVAAAVRCVAGVCDVADACQPGRGHCSARADDGCEVDFTSPAHCGSCAALCGELTPQCTRNATTGVYACTNECPTGQALCGATCIDVTADPLNCGACGHACPAPPGGTAACMGGACGPGCAAGLVPGSDGTCGPIPPLHLRAPLSTQHVTVRRPTLRWVLPPGVTGAHLEICRDRACTTPIAAVDVTGASYAVPTDLPAGTVFWRARGVAGSAMAAAFSPTWQFEVPARSAPVETSWGVVPDVNGDGNGDLVVGAYRAMYPAGRAYQYLSNGAGIAATPTPIDAPADGNGGFGGGVTTVGDVNGDGFVDVLIESDGVTDTAVGHEYLYLGSPTGLQLPYAQELIGPDGGAFGSGVAAVGDVDHDGYADVAIGAYMAGAGGRVYVYRGSRDGLDMRTPIQTLDGPGAGYRFGNGLAAPGDVNGDGHPDLVVTAPGANGGAGALFVYLGTGSGFAASGTMVPSPDAGMNAFGRDPNGGGDVNGDGYGDFVVGAPAYSGSLGRAYLYTGRAGAVAVVPAATMTGVDPAGGFGDDNKAAGDVDGDGYDDVIIGAWNAASGAGVLYVFRGGAAGLVTTARQSLPDPDGRGGFSGRVAGLGDIDHDGFADVSNGAPAWNNFAGRMFVYRGSAIGVAGAPATTLDGPDPSPAGRGEYGSATAHL